MIETLVVNQRGEAVTTLGTVNLIPAQTYLSCRRDGALVLIVMVDDILRTERRQGRDRPRWRSVSELPPLAAQVSGKQS
jgi:hypothetical protein